MNEDGKFCARRNQDGTPCICNLDVQMNGNCIFWKEPKKKSKQMFGWKDHEAKK